MKEETEHKKKEETEQIESRFSAEVTREKTIAIFKEFGFEVEKKGEEGEYYAHKGSTALAAVGGAFTPKYEMYCTISEEGEKAVVNLRAPITFFKGGGLIGKHRQKAKFHTVVTRLFEELTTTE